MGLLKNQFPTARDESQFQNSIPDKIAGVVRRVEGCPSWRFSEICADGAWG
jgi:hypothetical protein